MARMTHAEWLQYEAKRIPRLYPPAQGPAERESKLQDAIEAHLKSLGHACYFVRSRMDRPTTTTVGTPDFLGWLNGRPFALECKAKGKKPTVEQNGQLHWARLAGARTAVVYSLDQAVKFFKELATVDQTPWTEALGEP